MQWSRNFKTVHFATDLKQTPSRKSKILTQNSPTFAWGKTTLMILLRVDKIRFATNYKSKPFEKNKRIWHEWHFNFPALIIKLNVDVLDFQDFFCVTNVQQLHVSWWLHSFREMRTNIFRLILQKNFECAPRRTFPSHFEEEFWSARQVLRAFWKDAR